MRYRSNGWWKLAAYLCSALLATHCGGLIPYGDPGSSSSTSTRPPASGETTGDAGTTAQVLEEAVWTAVADVAGSTGPAATPPGTNTGAPGGTADGAGPTGGNGPTGGSGPTGPADHVPDGPVSGPPSDDPTFTVPGQSTDPNDPAAGGVVTVDWETTPVDDNDGVCLHFRDYQYQDPTLGTITISGDFCCHESDDVKLASIQFFICERDPQSAKPVVVKTSKGTYTLYPSSRREIVFAWVPGM